MTFEFTAPGRIVFGEGSARDVPTIAAGFGNRALLVQGASTRGHSLAAALEAAGLSVSTLAIAGEPRASAVEEAAARARRERCDVVISFGGGSVIDAGKAIAALVGNDAPLRDYLEVVGKGRPLANRGAPFIAIPTTAGTGAEVTRNAVLLVEEERVKVSLRSPLMLPAVAIVDPELTYSLPPRETATTGLDALTQCIEPLVCNRPNPLTDAMAREGIARAARSLARAFRDGHDVEARRDMSIAALCGGLALANAKLGAVHGFAAPLGGMFPDAPHGAICARLLPEVARVNVRALRERGENPAALARYDEVARLGTRDPHARADDAVAWLRALVAELGIAPLSSFGVRERDVTAIVPLAKRASSMQGNPVVLTDEELSEVLVGGVTGDVTG